MRMEHVEMEVRRTAVRALPRCVERGDPNAFEALQRQDRLPNGGRTAREGD